MIVAFTGKMGAGKNTAASMVNFIVNGYTFEDWNSDNMIEGGEPLFRLKQYRNKDYRYVNEKDLIAILKDDANDNSRQIDKPLTIFFEEKAFAAKLKDIAALLTGLPRENFDNRALRDEPLPCPELYDPMVIVQNSFQGVVFANLHNYTYRTFLQRLGTEAMRWGLHQDIWVNALMSEYGRIEDKFLWTKKIDSLHYADKNETLCGKPMLGNNYAKIYQEIDAELERIPRGVCENCKSKFYPDWVITDLRFDNEAEAIRERQGVIIEIVKLNVEYTSTHVSEEGVGYNYVDYTIQNDGTYEDLFNKLQQLKNFLL